MNYDIGRPGALNDRTITLIGSRKYVEKTAKGQRSQSGKFPIMQRVRCTNKSLEVNSEKRNMCSVARPLVKSCLRISSSRAIDSRD